MIWEWGEAVCARSDVTEVVFFRMFSVVMVMDN
jgi:hypothetical protein